MVRIYLSKLLGERRMSQRELSELTGIRPNTINEWYHEIVVSLRVEHIDRICEVLGCSVDELIEVIPNRNPKTGKHLIVEEHGNRKTGRGQWQKSRPLFCWGNGKYFPKVFDNYFENLWQKFWAATEMIPHMMENNTIGTTMNLSRFKKIVPNGLIYVSANWACFCRSNPAAIARTRAINICIASDIFFFSFINTILSFFFFRHK